MKKLCAPRLVLLCGLPGAGKTTLARKLAKEMPAVRLCPDEWLADLGLDLFDEELRDRLEKCLWKHAQELLKQGQTVILEYGFWLRWERDEKREGARALGAAVELHYLDVPLDELVRRVKHRNTLATHGTALIDPEQLKHWSTLFEAPDEAELKLYDN